MSLGIRGASTIPSGVPLMTSLGSGREHGRAVQEIADLITEDIVDGVVVAGEWLRQETIATKYGVSRQPVREALRLVEAAGLVQLVPNRGAVVLAPSLQDLTELYALRAQLEGFAAELAAVQREQRDLDELHAATALYACTSTRGLGADGSIPAEWTESNQRFHSALVDASGNQRLVLAIADANKGLPRGIIARANAADVDRTRASMAEHESILAAIEARDSTLARLRVIQHIRTDGDILAARALELGELRPEGSLPAP